MSDADRPADLSLESDRLEQLLEVPAPAQPVVMIEYRNRGVPWWLLVTLVVLVPLIAVIAYQQLVVQAYQERVANARYIAQKLETERTVEEPPQADAPPAQASTENAVPGAAPIVMSAQAAPPPAPAGAQPPASPAATPEVKPQPARSGPVDDPALAGGGQPPEPRVRSVFPNPFEPAVAPPAPKSAAASSIGRAGGSPGPTQGDDAVKTQLAGPQPAGAGVPDGTGDGGPAGSRDRAMVASDAGTSPAEPLGPPEQAAPLDPLPTQEEMRTQLAEEAARKHAEETEAALLLQDRLRMRRYEDRIRFHDELREILAGNVKNAASEIDELTKRERGDSDFRARARARGIWRQGRLPMARRVSLIRSLDVPESDILDLMSDNLYARMHAPGGPRDHNEVRVRAARLLLSCELPSGNSEPEAGSAPGSAPKPRRMTGTFSPQ